MPAGVVDVEGDFESGDTIDVVGPEGSVVARGLAVMSAEQTVVSKGRRTVDLPDGGPTVVVHRDGLVILSD